MCEKAVRKVLEPYAAVYVVEPVERTHPDYLCFLEYLNRFEISYTVLNKMEIYEKLQEDAIFIFLNEDERRGMQCLCGIEPKTYDYRGYNRFRFDMTNSEWCKARTTTFENLLLQIEEDEKFARLRIKKPTHLLYERVDDKPSFLLSALQQRGVNCFCLYMYEMEESEYGKQFQKEVMKRVNEIPLNQEERMWPEGREKEAFYGELYQIKDYKDGIAQKEIYQVNYSFGYKKNIVGNYFNASDGKRKTCFQPKEYIGTIYLLGLCTVVGLYVEHQHTVASYLQKKLLESGMPYRVENYGSMLRHDADIDSKLEEIGEYSLNDIVIYVSPQEEAAGIAGESIEKIFQKNQVPVEWVTDRYGHCNYKANQAMANGIFEMVESCLINNGMERDKTDMAISVDVNSIMGNYVRQDYLDCYFTDFSGMKYSTVGSIVMNCNPFSKGHRYLIEQASQQVDLLIVFVVEEDASLFSLEERFEMIREGVSDIDNIMLVPSGRFILSRNNFQEYFSKTEDEITALNAEYDITVFADYIAKPLHISHRFAGQEPEDRVTKVYNDVMRRILPQKGISFVEIPRIEIEDEIVSASRVRKYLKAEKYENAWKLLPDTTVQFLQQQLDIPEHCRRS